MANRNDREQLGLQLFCWPMGPEGLDVDSLVSTVDYVGKACGVYAAATLPGAGQDEVTATGSAAGAAASRAWGHGSTAQDGNRQAGLRLE